MPRPITPRSHRSATRHLLMRSTMLAAVVASGMLAASAFGQTLPSGGKVVAGTAGITTNGQTTLISQSSDKAIIDWQAFSIGQGNTVQFNNGSGATLNRVTGGNLSSIDGLLSATGSVYLINPNGVIIGKSGVVKVGGGFIASTLDIDNANFLNGGDQTLAGTSLASVVNLGKIGALGGDVALVAANVRNDGTVVAPNGTLGLLAGSRVLMRDTAINDGKFLVLAGGAGTSATNTGTIEAAAAELRAEGGSIYALAGNTTGLIRATGVSANDGRIFLTAGDGGSVTVSGSTLKASDAAGNGGLISITQGQVAVADDAVLDASATAATGQGGKVSVIADMTSGQLDFHGTALAKGGANGGNGGFVETSGHTVDFDGTKIDTSGTQSGTWLIDPYDLTIDQSAATTIDNSLSGGTDVTLKTTSNSASGPGTQNTSGSGDIVVNADLSWTGSHALTLDAYHSIQVNANITVQNNGGVVFKTNDGGSGGDYGFAFGKSLSYTGSGGSLNINGAGYTLLYSLSDFPQMESSMSNFALARSIDATGIIYSQAVVHGYSSNSTYAGTFTGLGNTISNLTVSTGGEWGSLFAFSSGTIRDIGLVGGSFSAYTDAAALVTYNYGTIINAWTSSTVSAFVEAGGLVDVNNGTIRNSFSTGVVGGVSGIGGLVSDNSGSISNSYSTATVSNTITQGGGLIAYNNGSVTNSYAAGKVNGAGAQGGLIGQYDGGTITNSYYDSAATGETDSGKGVGTSLTTGTLPSGFAGSGWSVTAGLYPYLTSVGLQTISGHAYASDGSVASGAGLALYSGGSHLTSATATSAADGSYSIVTMPGTTQAGLVETLNGASSNSGLAYSDRLLGSALDVTSGAMQFATEVTSYSTLKSNAALTFGASTYATLLTTLASASYDVNASGALTIDSAFESAGPVVIKALGGNLTLSSDQTLTGVTALTLDAHDNLAIDGNITSTGANAVTLKSGDGGSGDYTFALGKSLSFTGAGGSLTINGAAYILLYGLSDFSQLESSSGNFALATSLDAAGATYTTSNLVNNFGNSTTHQGIFTGLGHTVSNLNIVKSSNVTGLIGNNYGTIRDIGAVGISVSGGAYVGGLVAYNRSGATLANAWSSATVSGTSTYVGDLVGNNQGTVTNSFATGKVSGGSQVGGLAGKNGGTITNAYATGAVSGTSAVGGIVGENDATISNAYATGQVTASSNGSGSIGQKSGSSSNVYYDIGTSGVANDGTGMTTSQLQSALPAGFSSSTWAGGGGSLYPYLKTFFPTAIAAVSGTASDNNNAAVAGATLNLYSGGSLQGSAVSGANGYYYIALPLTANDGQAGITETLSGTGSVSGASFSDNGNLRYGGISGVNVASGAFNEYTSQNSYAATKTEATSTFGSSVYGSLLTTLASSPFNLYASSYSFTLDSNFDTTSPILVKTLNGNLTVTSDLTLTGTTGLTLEARNNLYIDGNITASGANAVTLIAADSGYGDYSFGYGKSLSYTGTGGSLTINGNPYTLVYSMSSLANLNNASGRYALATSLDASGTTYSAAVIGIFGNSSAQNAGTLTGLGNTISNLTITSSGDNVGLIGTNYGIVRDLGLTNVNLTTTGTNIGGLTGWNANGTLQNDYVSGTIQGNTAAGGLAGANNLTITNDFSSAAVSGQLDAGGLVGVSNSGTISGAYNLGSVTSTSVAGGIAGLNAGATISGVFSAGYVHSDDSQAGGIVGTNSSGSVYSAYYDNQTTGMSDSGKGQGMTTSQLKGGYWGMMMGQAWSGTNGLYPYLTTFGLQTISGYTYTSSGTTAGQATVGIYSGGSLFTSLTSGSNGAYSLSVLPGTLSPTGELGVVETLNGASSAAGATYFDISKSQVNVTAGVLQYTTSATSYGALQADAASAFGSTTYANLLTAIGGTNTLIAASGAFTFDQAATFAGNLSVTAGGGDIDVNGQISAGGDILLAADGKFVNTAGATALSAGGRYIVYTQDAANPTGALPTDTFNGLVATDYYNDAYDFTGKTFASAVPAAGNYFVYGYAARLTPTLSGSASQTYNGGTAVTDTSGLVIGRGTLLSNNDSVALSFTGASFDTKDAGTAKTVTAGGITLSSNPNNYILASTSTSANIGTINKATLTATLIGTVSKTYDTNTTATLTDSNYSLAGILNNEAVTVSATSAAYDNKNAATGKLVSASGLTLSGADDGNYVLSANTASATIGTINKATLTASLIGTVAKTYDTGTTATLTDNNYSLAGVLNNEAVGVTATSAVYDNKNAATNKLVTASGLTLSGADDGNYVLSANTAHANIGTIDKATLTASLIGTVSKTYDTNTTAALTDSNYSLAGILNNEAVTVSATSAAYDNKNAATGKLVSASGLTLSGADDGNYALASNTASANIGTIDKATLTASLIGTVSKTYDTTTAATLTDGNYSLAGILNNEAVTVSATSATYDNKNAATGKLVSASGLTLSGADDGNYVLSSTLASANIGTIDKASLIASLIGTVAKTYDTGTAATLTDSNYSLAGVLNNESVSVSATSATYDNKNVAAGKLVSASGLTLSGADDGNYTLASTTASANIGTINKATLTASLIGTVSKTYDTNTTATLTSGNYSLAGILNSEAVSVSATSATYDNKNAATGKLVSASGLILSGADDGNYTLASATASGAIGTINKATLTTSLIGAVSKTYDTNTTATLTSGNYSLAGVLNNESVSVSAASAIYDNKNAATGKTVTATGLSLSGTDDGNYVLASTTASGAIGTINKATLTASLIGNTSKTYDTNTTAILTSGNYSLAGVLGNESVGLNAPTTGTYIDKNAGTSKSVTASGLALTGADDGNYVLAATTASGNIGTINKATLTASLTGTTSKTYDATTAAALTASNYKLTGVLGSDSVSLTPPATGTYVDKNVGNSKAVTASGLTLSGTDGGNYALASTSISANIGAISQAALTITLTGAVSKVYDGAKTATLTSSNYTTTGVFQGDSVSFTAPVAGLFSDANVGTSKTITATLAKLSGTDAGNYTFNKSITGNIGTITARPVTITATSTNKNVGDTDPVLGDTLTAGTLVSGDAITGLPIRISGESPGAYAINQGSVAVSTGTTANLNYNITFIPGTFTINAAAAKASAVVVTTTSSSSGTSTTSSTGSTTSSTSTSSTTSSSSSSSSTTTSSSSTTGCSGGGCDTPYPSNQLISSSISFATN